MTACRKTPSDTWNLAALKIAYDLLLLAMFRKIRPPEEE
jgi:hypothetical protein